jgi:hypothetical protein
MSVDRPIPKEQVAMLLASALGQDKSDEIVAATAHALGFPRAAFNGEEVRALFERLAKAEGLVGVVARFAISRGDVARLIAGTPRRSSSTSHGLSAPSQPPASNPQPPPSVPHPVSDHVDLLPLLAPAIGSEKARDAIAVAARACGIDPMGRMSQRDALAVLDEMTKLDGIVGVVARFAKARFLLSPHG